MEKQVENKQFSLKARDWLIGLLMAVLTPVLVLVQQVLQTGELTFDWKVLGTAGIAGGVAYLLKNFVEPSKTVIIKKEGE